MGDNINSTRNQCPNLAQFEYGKSWLLLPYLAGKNAWVAQIYDIFIFLFEVRWGLCHDTELSSFTKSNINFSSDLYKIY